MKVKKYQKTVHLKLDEDELGNWEKIYYNDELFWNDLYIESSDGWLYLYDANRDKVCMLNSYGWDLLQELFEGKKIVCNYIPNDPDYEFNQE